MARLLGRKAVVIGGSLSGLMTARVLADHFAQVTILERDQIEDSPANHKSVPQAEHLHVLLLGGRQVMSSLYPEFTDKLDALGAVSFRSGVGGAYYLPDGKAYNSLGTVKRPYDLGFDIYTQSRGLLEHCVRRCTLEFTNISVKYGCSVRRLVYEGGRVQGVAFDCPDGPDTLAADLVVDSGGIGSRSSRWIQGLGFRAPEETCIGVDFGYASTTFRIPNHYSEPERFLGFMGPAPDYTRGALMGEIEDQTWHVTWAGRFGEFPPTDPDGFYAFAKSLHTSKLYELIKDAERVSEIVRYRFPTSVLRRFGDLTDFPEGFIVVGDAICSFNPIYGQGMTSAALQVRELQQLLIEHAAGPDSLDGLPSAFFARAAEAVSTPWAMAARSDFAYPSTKGDRPPDDPESREYLNALRSLAIEDMEVYKLLAEVTHLAKPWSALREEPIRSKVEALQRSAASGR